MSDESQDNSRRQVGVLAIVGVVVRAVSQSMSLILLLLAGHFLTVELFGVFVLASILMNFAVMQMYSGIYNYVLKEPNFDATRHTAFGLQILFSVFFAVTILLVAGVVNLAGWGELLAALIAATALMPVLAMLASWQEAVLLRKGSVKYYYASLLTSEVCGFALGVFLLLTGGGVWALIANRYCAACVMTAMLTLRVRSIPVPALNREHARSIIDFSVGLYGATAMSFVSAYGAAIVLGGFLSATAVGLFRMGARTATAAFDLFAQTFRVLTWQAVGRMSREERLPPELWTRLVAVTVSIMILVLGALSILAQPVTLLLLGEQWMPMVPVLQIMCWIKIMHTVDLVCTAQLAAVGQAKFLFRARVVEITVMMAALLATVQFGTVAVTFSLLPSTVLYIGLLLRKLAKMTGLSYVNVAKSVLPGVILSLLALVAVYAVSRIMVGQPVPLLIIATAVAGCAAYMGLAFVALREWTISSLHSVSVAILPARSNDAA
ncbi:oligosaccharide flippase family protein [Henriciella sp. AS95]|uniref:oligosaccharide flippase family protein n=1 Tax=Henriciella sp. AS95 TaxID=3135782 RepID=UPI003174346D